LRAEISEERPGRTFIIEPKKPTDSRRLIQLDVLRGVAILLVLGAHYVIDPRTAGLLRIPAIMLARFGGAGVDLFFVLSGFLVGGLLMREMKVYGKLDVKRFLIRRGFKIWPVYYLYLLVAAVMLVASGANYEVSNWKMLLPYVFSLQNYNIFHLSYAGPMFAGHTWSLAVEEHFYLLLPLFLLLLVRGGVKRLAWIPWIAIGLDVVCLLMRLRLVGQPFQPWVHQMPTHLRIDSLFTGVVLAYWYHFRPDITARLVQYRPLLAAAGLVLIAPMVALPLAEKVFVRTFGMTCLSVGFACLLTVFVTTPVGEGALGRWFHSRTARTLAFVGGFSYSIYIWHLDLVMSPIQHQVKAGLLAGLPPTARWFVVMLIYAVAAILLGIVLARLTERPSLLLRDKLFPARTDALGPVRVEDASPVTTEEAVASPA
jgi:peptidoglycan/LPS O-acetylase OafA/YrhL